MNFARYVLLVVCIAAIVVGVGLIAGDVRDKHFGIGCALVVAGVFMWAHLNFGRRS